MADVFEVIRQAHLTDAKQQEKGGLSYMKDYRTQVVKLPADFAVDDGFAGDHDEGLPLYG